jgi:hypothetical protein
LLTQTGRGSEDGNKRNTRNNKKEGKLRKHEEHKMGKIRKEKKRNGKKKKKKKLARGTHNSRKMSGRHFARFVNSEKRQHRHKENTQGIQ